MAKYPLDKLNDKELEDLVLDILQRELKVRFESFRRGKDKGIDLRYSCSKGANKIVVQVKHYQGSGIKKLLAVLKKEELPKVKKLSPKRYILVTSVPLNPSEKEAIKNIFSGYILSTGDIFGADDLDNSITRFPAVLKAHPKLYLTSLDVLNVVLNAHINSRSQDKIKLIQSKVHLFVQNDKYKEAIKVINKEHFLVITGDPGIGKTSLADFITYQHLADGFQFVYILSDLTDAEKMINTEEKILFYFDDFLGSNYLKIRTDAHHDSVLLDFIGRIRSSKNKRLILTTRTTILNQARADFEKLKNPVVDMSRHEIHITDYSEFQKAQILYNHIYHSQLDTKFVAAFINNKSYQTIIAHTSYNPRLISYIVDKTRLGTTTPDKYHEYITMKLDKPEDVWLDPYESQLDDGAKFLLQTLFTFPAFVPEQHIEDAFNERVNFEIATNGYRRRANLYTSTLYTLLGGFLHRRIGNSGVYLEFYNPSFADFMATFLSNNNEEVTRILKSLLFTDQFNQGFRLEELGANLLEESMKNSLFGPLFRTLEKVKVKRKKLLPILLARLEFLKPLDFSKSKELSLCAFLLGLFDLPSVDIKIADLYSRIDLKTISYKQFDDLFQLLDVLAYKETKTYKLVHADFDELIFKLFELAMYEEQFRSIQAFFEENRLNYADFRNRHYYKLQHIIDSFWKGSEIDSRIDNEDFTEIYDKNKMLEKLHKIEEEVEKLNRDLMLSKSPAFRDIYSWDYDEVIADNIRTKETEDYEAPVIKEQKVDKTKSTSELVENLFDNLLKIKKEKY